MASYAEDRAAIEQLEAEYLFAMDWGDAESYADLFAPDGVLEWARGRAVGPAEIREEVKRFKALIAQVYGRGVRTDGPWLCATSSPIRRSSSMARPPGARIYWFEVAITGPATRRSSQLRPL